MERSCGWGILGKSCLQNAAGNCWRRRDKRIQNTMEHKGNSKGSNVRLEGTLG